MKNSYNFDNIIKRENTGSIKYDLRKEYFGKSDVIPMWVADMDFAIPDFIQDAVIKRAHHPVYGYTALDESFFNSVINWMDKRHNWKVKKEWIGFTPGVVPALNFAILAFSKEGDGVIVQPPVYFPFFSAVKDNNRIMLENKLIYKDNYYTIDFNDLEEKAKKAKILLLSSPHNPVGRCWTKEELTKIGEICIRHNVIIVSDEIHHDLILPGYKHTPLATISESMANQTITCAAPSKTFNVAGLASSVSIISNPDLYKQFNSLLERLHVSRGNFFGYTALTAGYSKGSEWVDDLMKYIAGNFKYLDDFLNSELPEIHLTKEESTFLAWLDFTDTGLTDKKIKEKLIFEAGLAFSPGSIFGDGGKGFQRMNIAAPKKIIEKACEKLKEVF